MKNLKAGVKSFAKEDKGAIIVEASIVFPVMFFVLFFLILFGNVIYKQCQINSIVTEYAILGAQYCADPLLAQMEANGGAVPTSVDVKPYRYIFGNMGDVEDMIEERVKKALAGELTFLGECSLSLIRMPEKLLHIITMFFIRLFPSKFITRLNFLSDF